MPAVRVETRAGPRTFSGESIARDATGNDPRWIEFEIFELDDGAGFATVRGGMSRVYHDLRTRCTTADGGQAGVAVKVSEMLEICDRIEAEDGPLSCPRCQPPWPENLLPEDRVRFEMPRMTVDIYATARETIERLTTVRDRATGHTGTMISAPVARLLEKARRNNRQFHDAVLPEVTMRGPASSIGQLD